MKIFINTVFYVETYFMKKCKICQKELVQQQVKYCSGNCKQKSHYLRKKESRNCNTSYSQSKRHENRKLRFIKMLGNMCQNCGYNKNYSALHFHHLRDKEFQLDSRNIANRNEKILLLELDKCILLCANCHAELHYPHCEMPTN